SLRRRGPQRARFFARWGRKARDPYPQRGRGGQARTRLQNRYSLEKNMDSSRKKSAFGTSGSVLNINASLGHYRTSTKTSSETSDSTMLCLCPNHLLRCVSSRHFSFYYSLLLRFLPSSWIQTFTTACAGG